MTDSRLTNRVSLPFPISASPLQSSGAKPLCCGSPFQGALFTAVDIFLLGHERCRLDRRIWSLEYNNANLDVKSRANAAKGVGSPEH